MQEIIINLMNQFGYLGIFLLIAVENIFPPIPSEVILTFAGYMTTSTNLNVFFVIVVSTLGSLIGGIFLYFIGKLFNKERLIKIVKGKIGKVLCLKEEDILKATIWFDKKGEKCVFFCRFVPILRSLISIPAGMNEMNLPKFLIYTTIGSMIWNSILVVLGNLVGENWNKIVHIFETYSTITLCLLITLSLLFIIWFYKRKRKKQQA